MFHIFCDSLQEAQGLVEGNGHRDLGQFLFNIKIKAEYILHNITKAEIIESQQPKH